MKKDRFVDVVYILTTWSEVDRININSLRSMNQLIAKILTVYTSDNEAKKANSNIAKGLKVQLLLGKRLYVMLMANI